MRKGYFISFEGIDGSGKSTQIIKLKEMLENRGYNVLLTREPGGTLTGEKLRNLILDVSNDKIFPITEAFIYAASRAQHVSEVIKPALEKGEIVICDRFIDSSIAYQGYGRNLLHLVNEINSYAIQGCMPDITFFLEASAQTSNIRISNKKKDRIELEGDDFKRTVCMGYEQIKKDNVDRIVSIDATKEIDEIFEIIKAKTLRLIMGIEK